MLCRRPRCTLVALLVRYFAFHPDPDQLAPDHCSKQYSRTPGLVIIILYPPQAPALGLSQYTHHHVETLVLGRSHLLINSMASNADYYDRELVSRWISPLLKHGSQANNSVSSSIMRIRGHFPNPTRYISDVGAQRLKPLFIAMSAVTIVTFDIAFVLERWLRHTGRLTRNTSWFQRFCSIASIIAAIAGGAGLVLLAIFDTLRHPRAHNSFLALFLYVLLDESHCLSLLLT